MKVGQIYELVTEIIGQSVGEGIVLNEDLSNLVDFGNAAFLSSTNVDNYMKKMPDAIGRYIFKNLVYEGSASSLIMTEDEYGSIIAKITFTMPETRRNDSWNLKSGETYSQDTFLPAEAEVKFFNNKNTFEVRFSIAKDQVKESMRSVGDLGSFFDGIIVAAKNEIELGIEALTRTVINARIAKVFESKGITSDALAAKHTSPMLVNLLKLYNDAFPTKVLTRAEALEDFNFLAYSSKIIAMYVDRIKVANVLFNVGGKLRWTPATQSKLMFLSNFKYSSIFNLQGPSFNKELVQLPEAESVSFWQGCGDDFNFESVSKINVTNNLTPVEISGIVGILYDRDAMGVCGVAMKTATHVTELEEFSTTAFKYEAGYFADENENFIVFYLGEDNSTPIEPPAAMYPYYTNIQPGTNLMVTNAYVSGILEVETFNCGYMKHLSADASEFVDGYVDYAKLNDQGQPIFDPASGMTVGEGTVNGKSYIAHALSAIDGTPLFEQKAATVTAGVLGVTV